MPRRKVAPIAQERYKLRLVQQVPAGTAGARVDPVTGRSFLASWIGKGQAAGWVQADQTMTLNDAGEFTVVLPPVGPDGRNAADRFYFLAGTLDPGGSGQRQAYFPGDEFLELWRDGDARPVQVATPITSQVTGDQVQALCRDVWHLFKKTRETSSGFWCNAPRDVFEHYTRLWQMVLADDFQDSLTQFPASPGSGTTPNGRWVFSGASSQSGGGRVRVVSGGDAGVVQSTTTINDTDPHGCWRLETRLLPHVPPANYADGATLQVSLRGPVGPSVDILLGSTSAGPLLQVGMRAPGNPETFWPLLARPASDLLVSPGTFAIEARDRWIYFYADGQLVAVIPRILLGANVAAIVSWGTLLSGSIAWLDVDYITLRRTTRPLNAGQTGDYKLPSNPAAGGLAGTYHDLNSLIAQYGLTTAAALTQNPTLTPLQERVDAFPLAGGNPPAFPPTASGYPFFVRWTGSIYLPLDQQDVTVQMPSDNATGGLRVWIGKTRAGEQILSTWPGDTRVTTSGSLRGMFGQVAGWYPIVYEYAWGPAGNSNPNLLWNVGGSSVPVPADHLAPYGVHRAQTAAGDSHYDTLRSLCETFGYQTATQPQSLESGSFPGSLVPVARVGRDTEMTLTEQDSQDPQVQTTYEDVASSLLASAQGLGGGASGTLMAEAVDFLGVTTHPFISQETENLPSITVQSQFLQILLSLLGYRSSGWEDVQASTASVRQPQDTFPLTGALAEFDWKPGDGLRVKLPPLVDDVLPRQIFTVQRVAFPDGPAETRVSFRPRNRSPLETLRKFIRQVYGQRRTFQGQLTWTPGTRAVSPTYTEAVLPGDLSLVRAAELVVLSKTDGTTAFDVEVNGAVPLSMTQAVTATGTIQLGAYVARNGSEPRMIVRLINPSAPGCEVSYQLRLLTLIPAI